MFFCKLQLLLTGKFGRQESNVNISIGVRSLWAPVSLDGPSLILHNNVLVLGAQVPVSVYFCVSTRSLSLAKHFEFSFIFEKVYFAKPLLDERVLAQDVDCSLAAVVLRQREWRRAGKSTSAIEYPNRNSIIVHQCLFSCSH